MTDLSVQRPRPQRELVYNKFLPYSDRLEDESQNQLTKIKTHLSRAVLLKDIYPGVYYWSKSLQRYILDLYGHKFSKDDHVFFVKLYYELVTTPDIDPVWLQKFCEVLFILLKKKKLLKREDLELPWRPIYEIYNKLYYNSSGMVDMVLLPGGLRKSLKNAIRLCRMYFPSNCTQEMLDEWRPLMCIYDVTMAKAMVFFELFLPTTMKPEECDQGFRLWFTDFMKIWQMSHNVPSWESKLVKLFSRLANENISYIDWDPYIPLIFTRILRSFNLPVGYIKNIRSGSYSFKDTATESWIISLLGNSKTCQSHLNELFKALESYFHPSNAGRWTFNLSHLLSKVSERLHFRVYRERYQTNSWLTAIPDSHKLTDEDITEFVESIMPCVILTIFSKVGSGEAASAFRYLAKLRPKLVIPALLDRLYPALETLTEPHRLTATLTCIISVAPQLVKGGPDFPEGPSHVVPLLAMALPGIDTNDIKKCMATFQLISTFSSLILIDDCSGAVSTFSGLSEIETEVCLSTAQFEDFVLEFMNKCFNVIQNSAHEPTNRSDSDELSINSEEGLLEVGLSSAFTTILTHASIPIFKAALQKLQNFIFSRVLETKVAGKYAANMVRSAVRTNSELALKVFLPPVCNMIKTLTSNEEVLNEEILDDELMFNILLFSEILLAEGQNLIEYKHQIEDVLTILLKLTSKRGYKLAGCALQNTLNRTSSTYLKNVGYSTQDHPSDFLPIREWGKPSALKDLNIKWHIPNADEVAWGSHLLGKFLVPTLNELRGFSQGKLSLKREDVLKDLIVTSKCFTGVAALLPYWEEEPIRLLDSQVPLSVSPPVASASDYAITIYDKKNVRLEISNVMCELLGFILKNCEDDTRSLIQIINVLQSLMFYWGTSTCLYEKRSKGFHIIKEVFKNKFAGKKNLVRALHVDRLFLQHEARCLRRKWNPFTQRSEIIVKNLFRLATSHYSEVRIKSQRVLDEIYLLYPHSFHVIMPNILENISKDPMVAHEEFKGTLYILLGKRDRSLMVHSYMKPISKFWPAVIGMKHSEKPSIINLIDSMCDVIMKKMITYHIRYEISPSCFELVKTYCKLSENLSLANPLASESEMQEASVLFKKNCEAQVRLYLDLVEDLTSKMENDNLHWRQFEMAGLMLCVLIRKDVLLPTRTVNLCFNLLIHDSINMRKIGIDCCCLILKQQKIKNKCIEVDPSKLMPSSDSYLMSADVAPSNIGKSQGLKFGHRRDNLWLLYDRSAFPDSPQKFNNSLFVHQTHWGFFTWPKKFKVFQQDEDAYFSESRHMPDNVQVIFEKFRQKEFVDKFVDYLCLEDKKGKDKFELKRFILFKGLFRNYQDQVLPLLKGHLKEMSQSTTERKQQSAAEIIAGVIRGSKFWNYEKMEALQAFLSPVLKSALLKVSVETVNDWGNCISSSLESRDPNKYYWLIELLIDNPVNGENGSFVSCSNLYMILSGLGQQEWRIPEVMHRVFKYCIPYLSNPLQNVRDRMSSLLTAVFLYDGVPELYAETLFPKRVDLLDVVKPMLKTLEQHSWDEDIPQRNNHVIHASWEDKERKNSINLLKTVGKWIMATISRSPFPAPPEIFVLFPLICHYESDITDEELRQICSLTLATVGQAYLLPSTIEIAIATVQQVVVSKSWHARNAALKYLQLMVFYNFFSVRMNKKLVSSVNDLVVNLLEDEQVEVRESAAVTLSGLLQCQFLEISEKLIDNFKAKCNGRLKKKPSADKIITRHAGILGLSACVSAHPYDVPQYVPDLLMILGDHLHDPQPILSTVKKTLSGFKRTHTDSWRDHKLKFTDDQLTVLTDLLVSPSYYA